MVYNVTGIKFLAVSCNVKFATNKTREHLWWKINLQTTNTKTPHKFTTPITHKLIFLPWWF